MLQNFAHGTTTQLSCHVQNFIAITPLQLGWQQNRISIKFELRWKNRWWNGPVGAMFWSYLLGCFCKPHDEAPATPSLSDVYDYLLHWVKKKWLPSLKPHFKHIFLNENGSITIKISLKISLLRVQFIDSKSELGQMMFGSKQAPSHYLNQCQHSLLMHICFTQPWWVIVWVIGQELNEKL